LKFGALVVTVFACALTAQTPQLPPARPVASNGDTVPFSSLVSPIGEPLQIWPPQRHLYDAAFACESPNYLDIANDALEHGADPDLERLMPTKGLFGMDKGSAIAIAAYLAQTDEAKVQSALNPASLNPGDLAAPIPEATLVARDAAANCREMIQLMKSVRGSKPSAVNQPPAARKPVYAAFWRAEGRNIRASWGAGLSPELAEASATARRMCEEKTTACKPAGTCLMNPGWDKPGSDKPSSDKSDLNNSGDLRQWSAFVTNLEADRPASGFACGFPSYEEAQARAYRGCRYGDNLPRGFRCTTVWIRASDTIVDRGK